MKHEDLTILDCLEVFGRQVCMAELEQLQRDTQRGIRLIMFDKKIDVASIMAEVRQKALDKQTVGVSTQNSVSGDFDCTALKQISAELDRIGSFIVSTHSFTKEHGETAIRLPQSQYHSPLKRKTITFIRRCVRKLTRFIWTEQNAVNKSLNDNIKALYESQLQLTKSLKLLDVLITKQNQLSSKQSQFKSRQNQFEEQVVLLRDDVNLLKLESANTMLNDDLYFQFENRFRGSRDDIKQRQSYYLEHVMPFVRNKELDFVLDLGCGRGEWLEVMKENGMSARGVDSNPEMVSMCLDLGLNVEQSDLFEYLKSVPSNSIKLITGFHIIEHIPLYLFETLFTECYRALYNDGMLIFETPNAENVRVGAYNFYIDPSHKRPVHKEAISFVAESVGFHETRIVYPMEVEAINHWKDIVNYDETNETLPSAVRAVNDIVKAYFYNSADYAMIAIKR